MISVQLFNYFLRAYSAAQTPVIKQRRVKERNKAHIETQDKTNEYLSFI
jgi:hypothetical protein